MKYYWTLILFIPFIPLTSTASVPEGFEEFNIEKSVKEYFYLNDDNFIELSAKANEFKVTLDKSSSDELSKFLVENYVSKLEANDIVRRLNSGVGSSRYCAGRRSSCLVKGGGLKSTQFILVNNSNSVRIIVPANKMSTDKPTKKYVDDTIVGSNAIIMKNNINVGGGSDMDYYGTYNNVLTAGLYGGYIKSDLNLSTNDDDFDGHAYFDEFNYNFLNEDYRIRAGYISDNVQDKWNGTSILDANEKKSQVGISYGTSKTLTYKNKKSDKRLYFSVPSSGRLIIKDENNKSVVERNIDAGQQYISYSELPIGIHTLTLSVVQGASELYHETKKVYNTPDESLTLGEYDFQISTGALLEQDLVNNVSYIDDYDDFSDSAYIDTNIATKVTEELNLGLSVMNTKSSYFSKISLNYDYDNNIKFKSLYGMFDDKSKYGQVQLNLYGIRFDYSHFDDEQNDLSNTTLANYLYGFGSTTDMNVGYNYGIGPGNLYVNYSYSSNEGSGTVYLDENDDSYVKFNTANIGYSFRSWFNSTIDSNVTYTKSENTYSNDDDELEFSLSISIPFSNQAYVSYNVSSTSGYTNQRIAAGNNYTINDELNIGTEVGDTLNYDSISGHDNNADLSLSLGYHDEDLNASAYSYIDSDGVFNTFGDLSSTIIVNNNDIYASRDDSDTYLLIDNQGDSSPSIKDGGDKFMSVVNLKANEEQSGRITLSAPHEAYKLKSYKEYVVTLDEDASDFHNYGEKVKKATTYPGTVLRFKPDLRETRSFISVFNDIDGNAINNVNCQGQGCISVDELSEGVFKFKVIEGLSFNLINDGKRCVIPQISGNTNQNLGRNFCMPKFEESENYEYSYDNELNQYIYYIGEFTNVNAINKFQKEMKENGMDFIKKNVGDNTLLFIKSNKKITSSEVEQVENLSQYAIEERKENIFFASN